ncbi:hypothetical protein Q673_16395 [Marinobacter sp. EN3]|uniref:hypothetical protein n=1 Tax=Marinobacter sp. EN3 TaxID=1397533 RepID=UPI0003B8A973|nr:hypothetical protein [Marinobacter sp. EN3]ERS09626.1 hypothetical protein Q673_16395 [Marinobacter sp. EN3]
MRLFLSFLMFCSLAFVNGCANPYNKNMEDARKKDVPIFMTFGGAGLPNSAGGVGAKIGFTNISNKSFKYVEFYAVPYNKVKDVVYSEIGDESLKILKYTGPLKPSEYYYGSWANVWYNNNIVCFEVEKVKIIYMDGSVEQLTEDDMGEASIDDIGARCS